LPPAPVLENRPLVAARATPEPTGASSTSSP
jgi:hypothetical protein